MIDPLMSVLVEDPETSERLAPEIDDRDLQRLYEALVLTRTVDEQCMRLHRTGRLPLYVPCGRASAVAAGAALAIADEDWLFPGFRDLAAYLLRGGGVEALVAQVLASAGDPLRGRRLPGRPSLPDGRFVSISSALGNRAQHAVGVGIAIRRRHQERAALVICGQGDIEQGAFWNAVDVAARFRAPVVFVVRNDARVDVSDRVAGFGVGGWRVDGTDVLAVFKAVRAARGQAVGRGPKIVDAVTRGAPQDLLDGAADPASRLRPFLERRGLWDPGRQEDLLQQSNERVQNAIDAAESEGPPPVSSLFEDVWAEPPWPLQEQAELWAGRGAGQQAGEGRR